MGQRPVATLFFGYVFNERGVYPWIDDDYDLVANAHKDEWDDELITLDAHGVKNVQALTIQQTCDALNSLGAYMFAWGAQFDSSDCCYLITPNDSESLYETDWDAPLHIPINALVKEASWAKSVKEFADKMDINLKGQLPKWHLVSSLG